MAHPFAMQAPPAPRVVLFVCLHGAYRSRLAAAFFNAAAPSGWHATSAGIEPQDAISGSALELVDGTPGHAHLEQAPPRAIADAGRAERTVAIDWFRAETRRRRREETYARELAQSEELMDGLPGPLEQAVRELSPAEREVIALRVLLELDGPSAARVLGISQTACSTRLSRALKNLEEKIDVRD